MNWLLGKITGNPMLIAYVAGICFVAGMATAGVPIWKYQSALKESVQAKYDAFVLQTKTIGEAAEKANKEKEARDKAEKEKQDERYKNELADAADINKRLLHSRTSRSYAPSPGPDSGHPERACFDRDEFNAAVRRLDEGVSGLLAEGDGYRLGLNTAKEWIPNAVKCQ